MRSSIWARAKKAQSGGDLVVARAGGVEALAGVADDFDQAALDIKVDILVGFAPFEFAGIDFGFDFFESGANGAGVFGGDDFFAARAFWRGRSRRECRNGRGGGRNDTEALKRRARAVSGEAKRDERADFLSAAGITKGRSGKGGLYPTAAPKKRERFSPAPE